MRIYATNPLINDNPSTNLNTSFISGVTSLTVYSAAGFPSSSLALVGLYGDELSEIVTATIASNTLTLGAGTSYAHVQDTQVTYMPYDEVELSRSDDGGQTWSVITTTPIQTDRLTTVMIDNSGNASSLWRFRFKNSLTSVYSNYSSSLDPSGYKPYQLEKLQDREISLFNDEDLSFLKYTDLTDWFNEFSDELATEIYVTDKKALVSTVVVTGTSDNPVTVPITLPDDFVRLIFLRITYDGINYYKATPVDVTDDRFAGLEGDQNTEFNTDNPQYYREDDQVMLYPNSVNGGTQPVLGYKLMYYRLPYYLSNPSDSLDLIFRPFTAMYIDYAFMRAKMKDGKLNDKKVLDEYISECKGRFIETMSRWQVDQPEQWEDDSDFAYDLPRRIGKLT